MIQDKIFLTIQKFSMIEENDLIIAAVSGGADSMCMLHFLLNLRKDLPFRIKVAHLNHCLRGDESLRDQKFVEDFCKKNNIECQIKTVDINLMSKELNLGVEECGRKARYDFFNSLAGENGKIATAHTCSDNLETMIFNISRGCGIRGLSAISAKRDNVIRPLIEMTRNEVEEYCLQNNIQYITDSTNSDDKYSRNYIRHNIIPTLKCYNNNIEKKALNLSLSAKIDDDYLYQEAESFIKSYDEEINKDKFLSLPIPIQRRVMILLFKKYDVDFKYDKYDKIIESIILNKKIDVAKEYYIVSNNKIFKFEKKQKKLENSSNFEIKAVDLINSTKKNNNKIINLYKLENFEKSNKLLFNNLFDYDIIDENTLLRTRHQGDYFKQANRGNTKKLKKLYNELKLTKNEKENKLILANGNKVIWIEGLGVSQDAKISKITKNIAYITIMEEKNDD